MQFILDSLGKAVKITTGVLVLVLMIGIFLGMIMFGH